MKRSRFENEHSGALGRLLLELSSRLIVSAPDALDAITTEALSRAGYFFGASRAYCFDYDFNAGIAKLTHEWCRRGAAPMREGRRTARITAMREVSEAHVLGLPFIFDRGNVLEGTVFNDVIVSEGIKVMVLVPLISDGVCLGFIGFEIVDFSRRFSREDVSLFELFAQALVSGRQRAGNELRLRESSAELERTKKQAEARARDAISAYEAKSRFVASVSHEIRTPMHAILAYAEILDQDPLAATNAVHISAIREAAKHLLVLVDNVLNVSSAEASVDCENEGEFNPFELVMSVCATFQPLADRKHLLLTFEEEGDGAVNLNGDGEKLRLVIYNLLSNAIKFTKRGGVRVIVSCVPDPSPVSEKAPLARLSISVIDSGPGIAEGEQARIFEAFYRGRSLDQFSLEGTGIGLATVQAIASKMGGEIRCTSDLGRGSHFQFSVILPISKKSYLLADFAHCESSCEPSKDVDLNSVRILLAEDNPVSRNIAVLHLESFGCDVTLAQDGIECVECFRRKDFDLILMDIQMPVMDGFDAARQIRNGETGHVRTPIVAVTAAGSGDEKATYIAAGFDSVLIKPFNKADLRLSVESILSEQSG